MYKLAVIGQQCAGKTSAAHHIGTRFFGRVRHVKHAQPIYDVNKALGVDKHRAFMQGFGDLAKKHFGLHVFVERFTKEIKVLEAECYHDSLINDDTRFLFEMKVIKDLGFKVIFIDALSRVRRARAHSLGLSFIEDHNSEVEVPLLKDGADYIILDRGLTMDELYVRCNDAMGYLFNNGGE